MIQSASSGSDRTIDVSPVQTVIDSVEALITGFIEKLPTMGIAVIVLILILILGWVLKKAIVSVMKAARRRKALIRLAANLISIGTWIVAIAIAVAIIFPSVTPANLIAGIGLTSVAIGFAFKDVFENFLAGVIILGRKKMRIHDIIECEGVFGKIEDILIRETHVRETDGELVIVPNAFLFKNPLKIQTDQDIKRQELDIGVDYEADLDEVKRVLQDALGSCQTVSQARETEVKFTGFGDSSLNFKLLWWAESTPKAQRATFDEVGYAVWRGLAEADITIPFPQTTLSLRPEERPVRIASSEE